MAMVDYGAILKVNGKFINKNKNIGGFVIVGDKDFLLTFYKYSCYIYHNEKVISYTHEMPFNGMVIYNENLPSVKIEHLDKERQPWKSELFTWREYVDIHLFYANDLTEKDLKDIKNRYHKHYIKYLRRLKDKKRIDSQYKNYTPRWKATWDYKDNHYEVIFGAGIDPNEKVWNIIKNKAYDFTDYERKIIDEWFK